MNKNLSWLVNLATKTDFELNFQELLQKQSDEIKIAYQMNDQSLIRKLLSKKKENFASRNTIFQI